MKKNLSITAALMLSAAPLFAQDAIVLEDIIVSATNTPIEIGKVGTSVKVIEATDLNTVGNQRLIDAFSKTGGLSISSNGGTGTTGNVSIRGLPTQYIATYVDGIDVSDPSSTKVQFDDFGGLLTSNIRKIEILKGSQSAVHGPNAVAGVMTFDSLGLNDMEDGSNQLVDVSYGSNNSVSGSYAYTNRIGRLSTSFNVSSYQTDGISAASTNSLNYPNNENNAEKDSFEKDRIALGLEYAINDHFKIGANGFKETSKAEYDEYFFTYTDDRSGAIDGTPDEYSTREAIGYRVYAEGDFLNWKHKFDFSNYSVDRYSVSPTVAPQSASGAYESTFTGERQKLSYVASGEISSQLTLSLGLSETTDKAINEKLTSGRQKIKTSAVFGEVIYTPNDDLTVIANARSENNSKFGAVSTFRLATSYFVDANTNIRAAVSTGYRAPSAGEMYGQYPETFFIGNPDLKPEESVSYEVGFDTQTANGLSFSTTIFKTDVENYIKYFWDKDQIVGYMKNLSKTETNGIELELSKTIGSDTVFTANWMKLESVDAEGNQMSDVPSSKLNLSLNAAITDKLSAGLGYSIVKGLQSEDHVYSLIDVNANYQLSNSIQAYVNIDNIMDTDYETRKGYQSPGRMIFAGLRASF